MIDPSGEITSVTAMNAELRAHGLGADDPPVWFRGTFAEDHYLLPSVFRPPLEGQHEAEMLKRFIQGATPLLAESLTFPWEWLFLAQHHSVPTRLLDWTENPLMGLFFAAQPSSSDPDDPPEDGSLWILVPTALNERSLNQARPDLPMFGIDDVLNEYRPITGPATAVHLKPAAAMAPRTFLRISAQWGTFTIHTNVEALEDDANSHDYLRRFRVIGGAKAEILDELRFLGIEGRTVYPDLHHLGESIRDRFLQQG